MNDIKSSIYTSKPQLEVHEWLAVVIIICTLAMLTAISMLHSEELVPGSTGEDHYLKPQVVEVFVTGAVELPGSFKVSPAAKLSEVVGLGRPLKTADLRRFKGAAKVRAGQIINIPTKPQIVIHVSGAVINPGDVSVPRGTRLEELVDYVQFTEDADKDKMRRRRLLKASEKIVVPAKRL